MSAPRVRTCRSTKYGEEWRFTAKLHALSVPFQTFVHARRRVTIEVDPEYAELLQGLTPLPGDIDDYEDDLVTLKEVKP